MSYNLDSSQYSKTGAWVANGVDFTVGNLKFRVGPTNMLQVSHVSTPVVMLGQSWVGYANGAQTNQINFTTTTTPQYVGNPGWYVSAITSFGATQISDIFDKTNDIKYRVTLTLFSSNGGVSINYYAICVEKFVQ